MDATESSSGAGVVPTRRVPQRHLSAQHEVGSRQHRGQGDAHVYERPPGNLVNGSYGHGQLVSRLSSVAPLCRTLYPSWTNQRGENGGAESAGVQGGDCRVGEGHALPGILFRAFEPSGCPRSRQSPVYLLHNIPAASVNGDSCLSPHGRTAARRHDHPYPAIPCSNSNRAQGRQWRWSPYPIARDM